MDVYDEIEFALLAERRGVSGHRWRVTATDPPSLAVKVGPETVSLDVAHVLLPRIDVVCGRPLPDTDGPLAEMVGRPGRRIELIVLHGIPSPVPVAPALPVGAVRFATVRVNPLAAWICARDIAAEDAP